MSTPEVYDDWKPFGVVTGIADKSGIFNDTPGFEWGQGVVDSEGGKSNRRFVASCVDANDGHYVPFNESCGNITKATISSSSIPAAFEFRKWDNYDGKDVICIDGGSVWNINIASAIERCREVVSDDKDIILDTIFCDNQNNTLTWSDTNNALSTLEYYKNLKKRTSNSNNIAEIL